MLIFQPIPKVLVEGNKKSVLSILTETFRMGVKMDKKRGLYMNHDIERYLPLPLLLWRAITQPYWTCLELLVDLLLRIKLRQMDIVPKPMEKYSHKALRRW